MLKDLMYKHLIELLEKQNVILEEVLITPYGTIRYEVLKLHVSILDLRITIIKELFKINQRGE